jgi:tetrahydromethanopterin S-methyltransferase subunit G
MNVSEQVQLTDVMAILKSMQAEMATKDDLHALAARMDQMDARMDQMATKDDLHALAARMDQMDARLEQMDARMDQMDARLEQMDARLEQMDARMDQMATKDDLRALGVLFEEQRDHIKLLCESVAGLVERFDRFEARFDHLENRVMLLEVGRGDARRSR